MTAAVDAFELELRRDIDDLKRKIAALEAVERRRQGIEVLRRRPPLRIAIGIKPEAGD